MAVTSTARVATDRGERYRKQLASHFGNRIEIAESPASTVLKWGFGGTTTLTVEADALVMIAEAEDSQTLDRVKDVTGRHLERFGEKDGLVVTWQLTPVPTRGQVLMTSCRYDQQRRRG
jgi:uncharacterized protein